MTPPDDIKNLPDNEPSTPDKPAQPKRKLREIGPESEVRGGPEAPDEKPPE